MTKLLDFSKIEGDPILIDPDSFNSFGYGIISQRVTKCKNISLQAKGVFAYLVSCAGSDKQTYPTQSKMCDDLGIGKPITLRKYITELQTEGFVKIIKTMNKGLFYRNVYLICDSVSMQDKWKQEFENGEEIEEEIEQKVKEKMNKKAKPKKDNKKDSSVGADKSNIKTNKNSIDTNSITQNEKNIQEENNNFQYITDAGIEGTGKTSKKQKENIKKWDFKLLEECVNYMYQNCTDKFNLMYLISIYNNPMFKNMKTKTKATETPSKATGGIKTRFHNINQSFTKYKGDELEQMLLESQKGKFD